MLQKGSATDTRTDTDRQTPRHTHPDSVNFSCVPVRRAAYARAPGPLVSKLIILKILLFKSLCITYNYCWKRAQLAYINKKVKKITNICVLQKYLFGLYVSNLQNRNELNFLSWCGALTRYVRQ